MSEKTYQVTYPGNGRTWTLRPLPKHFYLFFSQLPTQLSETAVKALNSGDEKSFESEVQQQLSPKQLLDSAVFTREAVNFACVSPRIVLSPQKEDEISPFAVSDEEFEFLVKTVMNPQGGEAAAAKGFRRKPR